MLSSSASVKEGVLTLTLANSSLTEEAEIACRVCGFAAQQAAGRILTAEAHTCNDFDAPERVHIAQMPVQLGTDGILRLTLPACAVAEITLQ